MFIGVSFKIPQKVGIVLWQILNCINVEKYFWYIYQDEVWEKTPFGDVFFKNDGYDGNNFLQRILCDHYIVFLKLQAFFNDDENLYIHTYEEYKKSDCQLLLLIYDCEFVDIYAKDQILIETIYENARKYNYTNLKYITEENDPRTNMDVL
jgi:hypothetical protein